MFDQINQKHMDLISKIYDLPLYPEKWQAVLDEFAPMMNASLAGMAAVDHIYVENHVNVVTSNVGPTFLQDYRSQFPPGQQTPFTKMAINPQRGFITDMEMLDLDDYGQYAQRPAIQWLRKDHNIFHGAASCLNLERIWTDILFVMYSADRGSITEQEKHIGNFFLDHFAKSSELSRAFRLLRARFDGALTALDRFHIGIFVLSANGTVILKNAEADRIIEQNDGLTVSRDDRLYAADHEQKGKLKQAIGKAISTAQAQNTCAETVMTVTRDSGSEPYLVEVSPIRDDDEIERQFRGALVFVIDPAKTDVVTTEGMQALYGLTKSESEVCKLVAEGCATEDIADIRNITRETVRNYIKQVLQKTGTSNRSQLVRLALNVNLPIDPVSNRD
ncbi:MAG: LuxR C-terminal-related transcriptional regulator [Gammaproteobacteria bacterium]|nr:LuxR C-terminal-related transcriptional regulator [Gammaproteobacteria bacterium]